MRSRPGSAPTSSRNGRAGVRDRDRVAGRRSRDHVEQCGAVAHRAGEGVRAADRVRERFEERGVGHPSARRLEPEQAARGRRDADRAATVVPVRDRHHARRHRGRRATARAAGRSSEVVRVAGRPVEQRFGRAVLAQLGRVGHAQDDHARGARPRHREAVGARHVVRPQPGPTRRRAARPPARRAPSPGTGLPRTGRRPSGPAASLRAASKRSATSACTSGSTASMRAMAASTASTAVTSPARIAAARAVPSSSSYQPSATRAPYRVARVRGAGRGSVGRASCRAGATEQERATGDVGDHFDEHGGAGALASSRRSRSRSSGGARTPAPPTSATSPSSWRGPSAAAARAARPRSTTARSAASSPTSTPGASPAPPSPARPPRSAPTCASSGARACSTATSARCSARPKGASRLPRVIRNDEANDLLDEVADAVDLVAAEAGDDPVAVAVVLRDLAVLEVLYGAGLRVSECCGLRVADCDLDRGLVTVLGQGLEGAPGARSARPRVDALAAWLERRPPDARRPPTRRPTLVFLNQRGRALTPRDARRIARAAPAARRAGRPPARAPPRLRYAPARRRSRPPGSPGAPRPRRSRDHPDLHPRDPRPAPGRLRSDPPPCLTSIADRSADRRALDRLQGERHARPRASA